MQQNQDAWQVLDPLLIYPGPGLPNRTFCDKIKVIHIESLAIALLSTGNVASASEELAFNLVVVN